jgi:hypothetical protein
VLRAFYFCREFVLKARPWRWSPESERRIHGLGVELKEALLARVAGSTLSCVLPRERSCCGGVWLPPMSGSLRRLLLRRPWLPTCTSRTCALGVNALTFSAVFSCPIALAHAVLSSVPRVLRP